MKKIVLFGLTTALLATSASANDKAAVYDQAKKYAEVTACNTSFDWPDNKPTVYPIEIDKGSQTYLVLWEGDMGCSGGAATHGRALTVLSRMLPEYMPNKPFIVHTGDIFAQKIYGKTPINTRFVQSVSVSKDNVISVKASSFGSNDTDNNSPSLTYVYRISRDKNTGKWKLIGRNKQ